MTYTSKITADDIQFMDNSKDDSVLICFLKFSGFNKDWPDTLERRGVQYKFDGQEVLPAAMAGNYAGYAKYLKVVADVITLEQQNYLLNTDYTEAHQFHGMPFGLSIPAKAFEQVTRTEKLGCISEQNFSAFVKEVQELAASRNVDPANVRMGMYYDHVVIVGDIPESLSDWFSRLNRLRRNLLSQHFDKLQSQQRAEIDKISKDRKAYQTLLALQEKFSSYSPEQIADLQKNLKA